MIYLCLVGRHPAGRHGNQTCEVAMAGMLVVCCFSSRLAWLLPIVRGVWAVIREIENSLELK